MFSFGRPSSSSVYSLFFVFFNGDDSVRAFDFTSLGGGRFACFLLTFEADERGLLFPESPLEDDLPLTEGLFGAISVIYQDRASQVGIVQRKSNLRMSFCLR